MERRVRAALLLAAAGLGACEAGVLRLGSVLLYHGLAYATLAVALFGLAVGALWAARRPSPSGSVALALGAGAAAGAAFWLPRSDLAWGTASFAVPFVAFGSVSASALAAAPDARRRHLRYVAELVGAALGLGVVGPLALSRGGGAAALLAGASALAAATAVSATRRSGRVIATAGALTCLALAPSPWVAAKLPADVGVQRHLDADVARSGEPVRATAFGPAGRTDLVGAPDAAALRLYTDGMHVARAPRWDGHATRFDDAALEREVGLRRPALDGCRGGRVLVLGAGAGLDVVVALQAGAQRVDAVEQNAAMAELLRRHAPSHLTALRDARVRWHTEEGRRFLAAARATDRRWDCVLLGLVETAPAGLRGRTHVDARLLTREALALARGVLEPAGRVLVVHNRAALGTATLRAMDAAFGPGHAACAQLPDAPEQSAARVLCAASEEKEALSAVLVAARDAGATDGPVATAGRVPADDRPVLAYDAAFGWPAEAWVAAALLLLALPLLRRRRGATPLPRALPYAGVAAGLGGTTLQIVALARGVPWSGHPGTGASWMLAAALLAGAAATAWAHDAARRRWLGAGTTLAAMLALGPLAGPIDGALASAAGDLALLAAAAAAAVCGSAGALAFAALLAEPGMPADRLVGLDGLGALVAGALVAVALPTLGLTALGALGGFALLAALATARTPH
ncbi:MAG: hypothetical protein RIT45_921 [Pseudomonadota bacterium]